MSSPCHHRLLVARRGRCLNQPGGSFEAEVQARDMKTCCKKSVLVKNVRNGRFLVREEAIQNQSRKGVAVWSALDESLERPKREVPGP